MWGPTQDFESECFEVGKLRPPGCLRKFGCVQVNILLDHASFSFAIFEPLVLFEESSRKMSLGGKNKPIFAWIVWNGDPIQVYRLFESHGILQIFDFSVSLRLSDCPDSNPGTHLGPRVPTSRCPFSHRRVPDADCAIWRIIFADSCGALNVFVNVASFHGDNTGSNPVGDAK
jgi:hypothetical protein